MKTCKEMAKLWGVTERTVTTFCKTGKIPGAVKEGKSWRIPDEAEKPVDGRILSGKYVKKEEKEVLILFAICLLTFGFQMLFRKTVWGQRGLGARE